jgi:unsaturated chondroitin disaccharide hydrolase
VAEPRVVDQSALRPRLERAFEFASRQVRATIERTPAYFPIYTVDGHWQHAGEVWTDWCAGFHAGMMWLVACRTGDPWWRAAAERYSRILEPKKHDRAVHDLGFIFLNTYLPWYEASKDPHLRDVLIAAGRTLALRYNPNGRYLCSFLGSHSLFIDIMMNVPLVFLAARETGDDALLKIAVAHCDTTRSYLVRPDGGTAHEGIFDPVSGRFLRESTQQGLRDDSNWSRGLAWSLYGFGTVYSYTREPRDLVVAEQNAEHFLAGCPKSFVPPWDFDVPAGPERLDDSSAAAIAASGLWNLAQMSRDPARGERYKKSALSILDTLCSDHYLAWDQTGWEAVLKHGIYHFPKKLGVDESVAWGDFFFLEAVCKVLAAS